MVLKNKLGLIDPAALDRYERRSVVQRIDEGIPAGNFDLAHLRAIHRHLFQDVYDWAGDLKGLSARAFADKTGEIIGDINYVHPFREGNGRTQALYLEALAGQAGHAINLTRIVRGNWLEASKGAQGGRYERFGDCIHAALVAEAKGT